MIGHIYEIFTNALFLLDPNVLYLLLADYFLCVELCYFENLVMHIFLFDFLCLGT